MPTDLSLPSPPTGLGELVQTFGPGLAVAVLVAVFSWIGWLVKQWYARKLEVEKYLEPTLKASEEVVARIHWLAVRDFPEMDDLQDNRNSRGPHHNPYVDLEFALAFLFCQFEIIKSRAPSFTVMKHRRIKRIRDFFKCLESSRIRIVNRNVQRAAGELLLHDSGQQAHVIPLLRYRVTLGTKNDYSKFLQGLPEAVHSLDLKAPRQRLLVYGAVLHAMIETLDKNREVVRDIPAWPNKLSKRSRNILKYKVFNHHLRYVKNPEKYYAVPNRARLPVV